MRNEESKEILKMIAHPGLQHVVCFHLSAGSNEPAYAAFEAGAGVAEAGAEMAKSCKIHVASQDKITELITLI